MGLQAHIPRLQFNHSCTIGLLHKIPLKVVLLLNDARKPLVLINQIQSGKQLGL